MRARHKNWLTSSYAAVYGVSAQGFAVVHGAAAHSYAPIIRLTSVAFEDRIRLYAWTPTMYGLPPRAPAEYCQQ